MTDRDDIGDLLLRYATGIDTRDWPLFRSVFTADCVVDYGEIGTWRGVDAIADFMVRAHAMAGQTLHRITNIVVSVQGHRAVARSYVDGLVMAADGNSGVSAAGFYDDEIVRTSAGWQIARRRFTPVRVATLHS